MKLSLVIFKIIGVIGFLILGAAMLEQFKLIVPIFKFKVVDAVTKLLTGWLMAMCIVMMLFDRIIQHKAPENHLLIVDEDELEKELKSMPNEEIAYILGSDTRVIPLNPRTYQQDVDLHNEQQKGNSHITLYPPPPVDININYPIGNYWI